MKKNDYGKGVWFSVYNNLSYELRCYTRILALRKAVTTRVKKYDIFYVC